MSLNKILKQYSECKIKFVLRQDVLLQTGIFSLYNLIFDQFIKYFNLLNEKYSNCLLGVIIREKTKTSFSEIQQKDIEKSCIKLNQFITKPDFQEIEKLLKNSKLCKIKITDEYRMILQLAFENKKPVFDIIGCDQYHIIHNINNENKNDNFVKKIEYGFQRDESEIKKRINSENNRINFLLKEIEFIDSNTINLKEIEILKVLKTNINKRKLKNDVYNEVEKF